jgi:hypothetical protein
VHRCCARRGAPKPLLIVQDVNGRLYGTTYQSSHNDGSVFSLGVFPGNTFSTTQLSYGIQALNETSAARTVTVSHTDGVTLAISSINPTANFTVSWTTCAKPREMLRRNRSALSQEIHSLYFFGTVFRSPKIPLNWLRV